MEYKQYMWMKRTLSLTGKRLICCQGIILYSKVRGGHEKQTCKQHSSNIIIIEYLLM